MQKDPGGIYKFSRPLIKTLLSLATAALFMWLASVAGWSKEIFSWLSFAFGWVGFALCYLSLSWAIMFKSTPDIVDHLADKEDGSIAFVFVMVMFTTFMSLAVVLALVIGEKEHSIPEPYFIGLIIFALALSWSMVHTMYVLHYGRLYYKEDKGGLSFPEGEKFKPDYMDFAYFSFCIGCTFQVSDVEISDRRLRKVVLVHSLLSFAINTFLVALTINIIAGLSGSN